MKFTKNKAMALVVTFIAIAVYNVIAFVLPFQRHRGFWTGYSFAMLAILLTMGVGLFAVGQAGLKSKFLGMPLVAVVWTYFVIQIIVSLIEMLVPGVPFQYEIVLNVIILTVCVIGLIVTNVAKDEIERVEEKIKEKVFFIKSLQIDVEGLLTKVQDDSARKMLKDLAETICYSDPMSSDQLATVENKIEGKVAFLAENIENADVVKPLCDELQQLFGERNRKCKLLK